MWQFSGAESSSILPGDPQGVSQPSWGTQLESQGLPRGYGWFIGEKGSEKIGRKGRWWEVREERGGNITTSPNLTQTRMCMQLPRSLVKTQILGVTPEFLIQEVGSGDQQFSCLIHFQVRLMFLVRGPHFEVQIGDSAPLLDTVLLFIMGKQICSFQNNLAANS